MIINLIEKDNGTTLLAHKGDMVVITLEWKPSSGYFWQESEGNAGNLEEVKHNPLEDDKPGAPAIVSFKFKIINAGFLRLSYARPWAENDLPTKWFEVEVQL